MNLPFSADQLESHIQTDTSACKALLDLLAQEQQALKTRDADAVEKLLEKKVSLLEILEASAVTRQSWTRQINVESTESTWNHMLSELNNSDIKQRWQELKTLYQQVREKNEINGKLLTRHQATVSRLLDVMRGKTAGPNLYNATGYASSQASSNKFGEA